MDQNSLNKDIRLAHKRFQSLTAVCCLKFVLTVTVLSLSLSSCDLFFHTAHLRENVKDQNAQIPNLIVTQKSSDVVEAAFAWRPPDSVYDDTEEIEKVQLVYRVGDPPTSRVQVLPPETGGTKTFSRKNDTYGYFWELDHFDKGDVVWFALYPKVGMNWMAPRYDKVKVKDSISVRSPQTAAPVFSLLVDTENDNIFDNPDPTTAPAPMLKNDTATGARYLLLFFEPPDGKRVTEAYLEQDISTYTPIGGGIGGGTMHIHPLWSANFDNVNLYEIEERVDKTVGLASSLIIDDLQTPVDVTEIANRAILYGTNAIYLGVAEGNTGDDVNPPDISLTLTYQED